MARTAGEALERLVGIMARLRAEGGCPWDREQDLRSLRPYLIEEAYEVLDEMDRVAAGGPWGPLREELGDLLFQIVFHAQLAAELGEFRMADVCEAISDKIESRHPHVFAQGRVSGTEQVLANWARLKAEEKKRKTGSEGSVLDGVPSQAPALLRAERLTEKASRIGFDWPDLRGVRGKLDEELRELDEAVASQDRDALEHELGDVLFSLANLARFIKTPPEDALRGAIRRFVSRFSAIERGLAEAGVPFGKATLEDMEALWQKAKQGERLLPKPLALPRAAVAGFSFLTPRLAPVKDAWDRLAEALAWRIEPAPAGAARYDAGGLAIELKEGAPRAEGLTLELSAPSRASVDALAAALPQGMELLFAPRQDAPDRYSTGFRDPAGLTVCYVARGFPQAL